MGWPPPEFWLPARTHLRVHIQLKYVMLGGQHNFQLKQKIFDHFDYHFIFNFSLYLGPPLQN